MILTFEAASAEQMLAKLQEAVKVFGANSSSTSDVSYPTNGLSVVTHCDKKYYVKLEDGTTTETAATENTGKPRGRKKKTAAETVTPSEETNPVVSQRTTETTSEMIPVDTGTPTEVMTVTVTRDDAMGALSALVKLQSLDAGRDVLSRFGCGRFSELDPLQYGEFVKECERVTAGGAA